MKQLPQTRLWVYCLTQVFHSASNILSAYLMKRQDLLMGINDYRLCPLVFHTFAYISFETLILSPTHAPSI